MHVTFQNICFTFIFYKICFKIIRVPPLDGFFFTKRRFYSLDSPLSFLVFITWVELIIQPVIQEFDEREVDYGFPGEWWVVDSENPRRISRAVNSLWIFSSSSRRSDVYRLMKSRNPVEWSAWIISDLS